MGYVLYLVALQGWGGVLELWDGDYDEWQADQLFTWTCTNQTTSWLMHSWNTFGARMNHKQTRTHKIHHSLDLGETTTFPLIMLSMPGHGPYTQMSFCHGTPKLGILKFPKLGLLQLWKLITSYVNLWLRWSLKQSCSPH